MANRIIAVTLYSGVPHPGVLTGTLPTSDPVYLMNIQPGNIVLNPGDNVYLTVDYAQAGTFTGVATFTSISTSIPLSTQVSPSPIYPIGTSPTIAIQGGNEQLNFGDIYWIGTVHSTISASAVYTYTLTLTVSINGQTYTFSEDPKIQVNPD